MRIFRHQHITRATAILALIGPSLLNACGAPEVQSTQQAAIVATEAGQRATQSHAASPGVAPEVAKRPSPAPRSPIAVERTAPTAAPIIAAQPLAASPTPIQAVAATAAKSQLRFRVVETEDHFVSIREQPTTRSREVGRLSAGDLVVCSGVVHGAALEYLGQRSDRWAACPSVGGYIFSLLLLPQ